MSGSTCLRASLSAFPSPSRTCQEYFPSVVDCPHSHERRLQRAISASDGEVGVVEQTECRMEIKLTKSVVKGVCTVDGPQVPFVLGDSGQANVLINVALSDGTHIHFPDGSGVQTSRTTVLPPGDYDCSINIVAFSHGAFGSSFNASVSVGDKKVATAVGEVATDTEQEDNIKSFLLRVR